MDGGLLALTWNNHRKTFFQILSTVRKKNTYADVTLACDGKFYQAHKLVLSTCSDYFKQMFEQMESNHIMIVLKDIKSGELELLLDYMYNGEVNVVQDEISGLIKAAECLQIKGLAVSDQDQSVSKQMSRDKRTSDTSSSSGAKRQRLEEESYISAAPDLRTSNKNGNKSAETKKTKNRDQHKSNLNNSSSTSNNTRHNRHMESLSTKDIQVMNVKTEDHDNSHEPNSNADVITQEAITTVKQEEIEWDTDDVPLSDCNSVTEADKSLRDEFGGKGYHQQFTDGLFVQDFPTTKQKIGDNMDTGHNARSSSSRDQQREEHAATNPWPHLEEFFFYKSREGEKLLFHCNLCWPKIAPIRGHITSLNNLRQHITRLHPHKFHEFNELIKANANRRKGRPRMGSFSGGNSQCVPPTAPL